MLNKEKIIKVIITTFVSLLVIMSGCVKNHQEKQTPEVFDIHSLFKEKKRYNEAAWKSGDKRTQAQIALYIVANGSLNGKTKQEITQMLGRGQKAPAELDNAAQCRAWYLGKMTTAAEMPPIHPYYDTYLIIRFNDKEIVDMVRLYQKVPKKFEDLYKFG